MSNCPPLLKRKQRQFIGFLIAFVLITGMFVIIAFINIDASIQLKISDSFFVRNNFKVPSYDFSSSEFGNETVNISNASEYSVTIDTVGAIFESELYKDNQSTITQMILQGERDNKIRLDNASMTHVNVFMVAGYEIVRFEATYRGLTVNYKLPRGNGLLYLIVGVSISNILHPERVTLGATFYGIINDDMASMKELGYYNTQIAFNYLQFVDSAYDDYYNYMANRTQTPPTVYPYQVVLDIQQLPLTITDFMGVG